MKKNIQHRKSLTLIILLITLLIASLVPQVISEDPLLSINDFDYGAELAASESEFRQFTLKPEMIKNIKRQDLGDVRIFDGNNELIPSLVRKKDGDNKLKRQSLSFTRVLDADSTTAYILDRTEDHKRSLKSLSLQWKQGSAPNILLIRVEHSADKKSWKKLNDSETVINFKFEGLVLKQNVIDINRQTQRYIKIKFLNKKRSPALASVHAYTTNKQISDYSWIPAGKLQPQSGIANGYRFNLNEGIKPELFKLNFPSLNTILKGSLNTIKAGEGKLKYKPVIKNFNAYIVTINNKIIKSRAINISRWQSADWLITASVSKNIQADNLPGVTLAYPQYELIFANNNEGPYTVVWGNSAAGKPVAGDILERIKDQQDIAEVKPGVMLNINQLTELMESRQTPWLMISISLAILAMAVVAFLFGYRRYQLGRD